VDGTSLQSPGGADVSKWKHAKYWVVLLAVTSSALVVTVAPASGGTAVAFTWGSPASESWCPTFHGYDGCDNTQSPSEFTTSFSPSQVTVSSGAVNLAMNSALTTSGAFNTSDTPGPLEVFTAPYTISTKIFLPCSAGKIDNWPAVWLAEQGSGSQYSEIDLAEGEKGSLYGTIWYGSPSAPQRVYAKYASRGNFPCGSSGAGEDNTFTAHTYRNSQGYLETDLSVNGTEIVGASYACSAPCTGVGTTLPTDPLFMVYDYAGGSESGPAVGSTTMRVLSFSYSDG
jgi:hypothetical protein